MANPANFYDYALEEEGLKRRQALLDAMQQRTAEPLQPTQVGGMAAAPTGLGVIAKLLEHYKNLKDQQQLAMDRAAASERYSTGMRKGFEDFYRTAEGSSAPSMAMEPNPDGTPQMQTVPGDRRKAIFDALASGHPVLREFAMRQLASGEKDSLHPKDLLAYADPASIPDIVQRGAAGFRPKRDIRSLDKTFYDLSGVAPKPIGGTTYTPVPLPDGLGQRDNVTGELAMVDKRPNVRVNASPVIMGQKAGVQEYFKDAAQQVGALGKQANASQQLLATLDTLQKLHQAGINSNITSGMATTLQNVAQQMGIKNVDAAKLANTETYNSLITDLWQRSVAQYGGNRGVTQAEAEEIKKLTPLASTSPAAREQLFAIQRAAALRNIAAYKEANKSFAIAAAADDPRLFQIPEYLQGTYIPEAADKTFPNVALPSQQESPSWLPPGFKIRNVREK